MLVCSFLFFVDIAEISSPRNWNNRSTACRESPSLDNSMLMMCSSMMSGIHDATKLPVVVLGRGGGQLDGQAGRGLIPAR
ncbi:MAG: hypothetical protein CMJ45_14630 [Planctomyces sp.]|nr:hypothetical protein [Planctomyces sp.]